MGRSGTPGRPRTPLGSTVSSPRIYCAEDRSEPGSKLRPRGARVGDHVHPTEADHIALVIIARCVSTLKPRQDGLAASSLITMFNEPSHYIRHDEVRQDRSVVVMQVFR